MSKTIRLEDEVYNDLDNLRGKGETFSDVVADMIKARSYIFQVIGVLEGAVKYREWQAKKLQELVYDDRRGAGEEVPDLR